MLCHFNSPSISNGARVSTTIEEPYPFEEERKFGLIYSGLYNGSSGLNNLNQFIQAEKITKDLNPTYGSIQKLLLKNLIELILQIKVEALFLGFLWTV